MTTPEPTPSTPQLPLPSYAGLIKATAIAAGLALLLLVFVVLPAEYQIDPTGFGAAIGLTRLSAPIEEGVAAPGTPGEAAAGQREDSVVVEVPPGKGIEYKFALRAGEKLTYEWKSSAGSLFFDFHGEPEGDTTGFFESYVIATANKTKGTLTAPFTGSHGWYWKNKSSRPANVSLSTSGSYEILGLR